MVRRCILFLFIISVFSCATVGGIITKQEVESFVESVDQACIQKNLDVVRESLSDSIKVIVEVNDFGTQYFNKEDYLMLLKENWEKAESYSYQKISSNVEVLDKMKAIVRENVLEKLVIDGNTYHVLNNLTTEVHLINGKLVATRIDAVSSIQVEERKH